MAAQIATLRGHIFGEEIHADAILRIQSLLADAVREQAAAMGENEMYLGKGIVLGTAIMLLGVLACSQRDTDDNNRAS
jgi:hypothetical protein